MSERQIAFWRQESNRKKFVMTEQTVVKEPLDQETFLG